MPGLSVIFFDIDDTLFPTTEFTRSARECAVQAMIDAGLRALPEEALQVLYEIIEEYGSNYEHHYDMFIQRFSPERHAPVNRALIVAAGVVAYHDTKFRDLSPYEDAIEVLRRLSDSGQARLGIISAGHAIKQAEKIVRLSLTAYFDPAAIFIADQMSLSKLNPLLYARACEQLGALPERCMHVGDNPLGDIDSANEAGLVTVLSRRGGAGGAGKYAAVKGQTQADYTIANFWDLMDILEREYGFKR